jgi:hypothetical protein
MDKIIPFKTHSQTKRNKALKNEELMDDVSIKILNERSIFF